MRNFGLAYLLATFIVLLPRLAAAQLNMYAKNNDDERRLFSGGLALGVNFSQVDGDSYYGYHKVGLNAGALVYAHFTPVFGASVELLYSRKGSRGETITESPSIGQYVTKYYMDINYMEVPVLLHVITHNLDVEAGVSAAYLVSFSESILTDQPINIDPVTNRFNSFDLDFDLGLTKRVYKQFYLNCRYQYSLTSIRPPERIPVGYSYGNSGQYNNLFNLRVLVIF